MRIFQKFILPGLAVFLFARAAQMLAPLPESVVPIWPAAGIAFAAFYLLGAAPAIGILCADALAAVMVGNPPGAALMLAGGNTLCMGLGGLGLRRLTPKACFLDSPGGTLKFIVAGPFLSALLAALMGAGTMKFGTGLPENDALLPYLTWYVSDMTGIVIMAPLLVAWSRRPAALPPFLRSLEGIGMFASAAVLSHFVFSSESHLAFSRYPLPFVFIPIMAWATFRSSHRVITLLLALIFFYAVLWTLAGQGHFAGMGYPFSIHILQIFTTSAALTSLIVRSLVDSIKAKELALQRANEELEKRVKQRTQHLNKAMKDLKAAEDSYRTIFENAAEGIYRTEMHRRFVKANQALAKILGYPDAKTLISEVDDVNNMLVEPSDRTRFYKQIADQGQVLNFEFRARRRDGIVIWLSLSSRPLVDKDGQIIGTEGIVQDITGRKLSEQDLERRASRDPLTGAANRHFFEHSFETMLAQAKRTGTGLALLFLDMDDFKNINDTYGHLAGDEVLVETVKRIQSRLRKADLLGRIGGDEFALLAHNVKDPKHAMRLAESILAALAADFIINGRHLQVRVSIGGCLYPKDGTDMETLLERADMAMYTAKQQGKGQAVLWVAEPKNTEHHP